MGKKTSRYRYCFVPTCKNTTISSPSKIFFTVPQKSDIRKLWLEKVGRDPTPFSGKTVFRCCEDHFNIEEDTEGLEFYRLMNGNSSLRIKQGVLPHKFIKQSKKDSMPFVQGIGTMGQHESVKSNKRNNKGDITINIADRKSQDYNNIRRYELEEESVMKRLRPDICQQSTSSGRRGPPRRNRMKTDMAYKWVRNSPYLTMGVPRSAWNMIHSLARFIHESELYVMICMKKLRLNNSYEDLGEDFGYPGLHMAKVVERVLPKMATVLGKSIRWPSPDDHNMSLPSLFRPHFNQVIAVIHCLEVEVQRPPDLIGLAMTWSDCHKIHTLKYLISCTPDGKVSYTSSGFGGHTSDSKIIKQSGFLHKLYPQEEVLAGLGMQFVDSDFASAGVRLRSLETEPTTSREGDILLPTENIIERIRDFAVMKLNAKLDHRFVCFMDSAIQTICGLLNSCYNQTESFFF